MVPGAVGMDQFGPRARRKCLEYKSVSFGSIQ